LTKEGEAKDVPLGYDFNYVTNQFKEGNLRLVAKVVHPKTGRFMTVKSDAPGL